MPSWQCHRPRSGSRCEQCLQNPLGAVAHETGARNRQKPRGGGSCAIRDSEWGGGEGLVSQVSQVTQYGTFLCLSFSFSARVFRENK